MFFLPLFHRLHQSISLFLSLELFGLFRDCSVLNLFWWPFLSLFHCEKECLSLPGIIGHHTTGRFSTAKGKSTIIVANREWSDSHANASRLCSSAGWQRNESLCTISTEKTRRALKILQFFRHFSTTRTYLGDNCARERGPIVSVGVDPTGTFWSRLATFHVYDQITIATRRQTSICPSCESSIRRLFWVVFCLLAVHLVAVYGRKPISQWKNIRIFQT